MIVWRLPGNLFGMSARMLSLSLVLVSFATLAAPKDINVVDDVGVGDHFPSQVPGAAPYRLPELDHAPAPAPAAERNVPERPASDPTEWATIDKPVKVAEAPKPAPVEAPAAAVVTVGAVSATVAQAPAAPAPAAPAPAPAAAPVAPPAAAPVAAAPAAPAASAAPDIEREVLARASRALLQGKCETELPALAELIDGTDRPEVKARARILRARCFTQRAKPDQAKAEYAVYVHDFPNGAWVAEARGAAQ